MPDMSSKRSAQAAGGESQANPGRDHSKKVCIVGGVTREECMPGWSDDSREYWGLNAIRPAWFPNNRWTRWFNLHRYAHLRRDWADGLEREIEWARNNPRVPFHVLDEWTSELPNRVLFPHQMGFARDTYHAGSFDMLVAYAVMQGFTLIELHGVRLDDPHAEPISARACLEYWIGFAEGRGCTVKVGDDCELMAQYHLVKSHTTYGWDDIKLIEQR